MHAFLGHHSEARAYGILKPTKNRVFLVESEAIENNQSLIAINNLIDIERLNLYSADG